MGKETFDLIPFSKHGLHIIFNSVFNTILAFGLFKHTCVMSVSRWVPYYYFKNFVFFFYWLAGVSKAIIFFLNKIQSIVEQIHQNIQQMWVKYGLYIKINKF